MKILGLRFANLNSLEGEWEIDFTRPEYASDGIFAIIGPTGSGKSTILDALCLALYGQTPRLGKITRSSNELMSRHAGECFAEATFSTGKGVFRCHWSQHRARHRAGAELQTQKHELSDAGGRILHTKLLDTLAAIEELVGMDFDRFTRSMLLAQGGFAAFLQADPDRRAPVLEQITGTEVYSTISMRVHERQRAERSKLELLRAETGSLRGLDPETLAAMKEQLDQLVEEERVARAGLESASAELRWHETITGLQAELARIDRGLEELAAEREAFAPMEERLMLAQRAASLDHRFAPLEHQRNELERDAALLSEKQALLPMLETASREAGGEEAAATDALQSAAAAEISARPLHDRVVAIDLELSEKRRLLEHARSELGGLERQIGHLLEARAAAAVVLDRDRDELAVAEAWLEANRTDAAIAAGLSGIRHAVQELRATTRRAASMETAVASATEGLHAGVEAVGLLQKATDASNARLADARRELDVLKAAFTRLMDGRTLKSLRADLDRSNSRRQLLDDVAALYVSGKELSTRIEAVAAEILALGTLGREDESKLVHARELLTHAEREVSLLEENLRLAARVRSYEEERNRLADGAPCPLCGATEHPWADGAPQGGGVDEDSLMGPKRIVQRHAGTVRGLEIAIAESAARLGQLELRQAELVAERESSRSRCLALLIEAGITEPAREAEAEVLRARDAALGLIVGLETLIAEGEALDERIRGSEAGLQAQQEAYNDELRRLEQAKANSTVASAELARLEAALSEVRRERDGRRGALVLLVEPFGVAADGDADLDAVVDGLHARRDRWSSAEARRVVLVREIAEHDRTLSVLDAQVGTLQAELAKRQVAVTASVRDVEVLAAQRAELFGTIDPLREAERLATATGVAREALEAFRERAANTRQELQVLLTAVASLQRSLDERRSLLQELDTAFQRELAAKGFMNEQAWLDARLPEGERERLQAVAAELAGRRRELEARRRDPVRNMQRAQAEISGVRPAESLAALIPELDESARRIREEIGAIRQQLVEHERAAEEQRERAVAIDAQTVECRRWDLLHDLIGSADGKKFRNFAQGLTFEIMVSHANRQLLLMSDRYRLVRNVVVPLELDVIDTWQAGEVRSTRNLSGGESFIVSLALALGLSQIASRNVRVDSLFLDEGFGTLDEETLETALETLSSLQQSGKLIGVISHVPALKERISTQILVSPINGGRSSISGPGVARR